MPRGRFETHEPRFAFLADGSKFRPYIRVIRPGDKATVGGRPDLIENVKCDGLKIVCHHSTTKKGVHYTVRCLHCGNQFISKLSSILDGWEECPECHEGKIVC